MIQPGSVGAASEFTLWRTSMGRHDAHCIAAAGRFGWEAEIRVNGRMLYSHHLRNLDEIVRWSLVRLAGFTNSGWTLEPEAETSSSSAPPDLYVLASTSLLVN